MRRKKMAKKAQDKQALEQLRAKQRAAGEKEASSPSESDEADDNDEEAKEVLSSEEDDDGLTLSQLLGRRPQVSS